MRLRAGGRHAAKKWPSSRLGQWHGQAVLGDLPASATFPHWREAHKWRDFAQQGLRLQRRLVAWSLWRCKLIFAQVSIILRAPDVTRFIGSRLDITGGGWSLCGCPPLCLCQSVRWRETSRMWKGNSAVAVRVCLSICYKMRPQSLRERADNDRTKMELGVASTVDPANHLACYDTEERCREGQRVRDALLVERAGRGVRRGPVTRDLRVACECGGCGRRGCLEDGSHISGGRIDDHAGRVLVNTGRVERFARR